MSKCNNLVLQVIYELFKLSRFVGICIDRGGAGLRAWFILRNVVEGQGVEFMYEMYNPTLVKVCIKPRGNIILTFF